MTNTLDIFDTDAVENALQVVAEQQAAAADDAARDLADQANLVIELLDPKRVAPHPFNAPSRSEPAPDDPEYAELLEDVRAEGGNVAPALVVTRGAFVAARPNLADQIPEDAEYVAIYGHRRRVVAIETGTPFKAEINDSTMENDGDLRALASENKGRKNFTELDEALMYQRSIDAGLSQHQLVEILNGVVQATISRRLALLRLVPELQQAILGKNKAFKDVNGKPRKLPSAEAAVIAGKFPYGELGKTKLKKNQVAPETTKERYDAQLAVLTRIYDNRFEKAADACAVVARKLAALADAKSVKAKVVTDARKVIGDGYSKHEITGAAAIKEASKNNELVAEVSERTGAVTYYTKAKPPKAPKPEPKPHEVAEKENAAQEKIARKGRWTVLLEMVKTPMSQRDLLPLLARQYHNGMAQSAGSGNGGMMAQKLCHEANIGPNFGDEWRSDMEVNEDPKWDLHAAWVRALAAHEVTTRQANRHWDALDVWYFELLEKRGNHKPTEWETKRLSEARRRIEAAAKADEPKAADEADEPKAAADDADEPKAAHSE